MKKWLLIAVALHMSVMPGFAEERRAEDIARDILMCCRGPEDPLPDEDLASFAMRKGLSDEDISGMLVRFVEDGLGGGGDAVERQLTGASLWALARFGGKRESLFVRQIMRETEDAGLRQTAVRVGMRLAPDNWEEWLREVATDGRFDDLTRFDACEEAYRIGQNADGQTRQRVEQVLSELAEKEDNPGNRSNMRCWAEVLKEAGGK